MTESLPFVVTTDMACAPAIHVNVSKEPQPLQLYDLNKGTGISAVNIFPLETQKNSIGASEIQLIELVKER